MRSKLIEKAHIHAIRIMSTPGSKLSMLNDVRAQGGTIMALVTAGIMILIGVVIFASVIQSAPAVNSAAANSTITSVQTTFYAAMGLVVVGILVMAAIFILNVVQSMGK